MVQDLPYESWRSHGFSLRSWSMPSIVLDWVASAAGLGTPGNMSPEAWLIERIAQTSIGLCWLTILGIFAVLAIKRRDLLPPKAGLLGGAVILLAGASSLLAAASVWMQPTETAVVLNVADGLVLTVATIVLWRSLRKILTLPSRADLYAAISQLSAETAEREAAQAELEDRMAERIADQIHSNTELLAEIAQKRDLTNQLQQARDLAESASRVKSMFLASMSHDLRTPLNAIIGFSEMILEEVRGPIGHPKYHAYIGDIHRSGQLLLSLINNILDLSKIEAGKYELTPHLIDGKKIIAECVALVVGQVDHVEIEPNLKIQGDGRIYADELALRQILLNVIGNAAKFTPAGGQITIGLSPTTDGRMLTVADTGIGMDNSGIRKALEPFGQATQDAQPRGSGSGLGLTIVTRLVDAHGGRFTIDSAPGYGTTVRIWLPDPAAPCSHHSAALNLVE